LAVDTANKRASVLGYNGPFGIAFPIPDASIGTADCPHIAGVYAGLTYEAVSLTAIVSAPRGTLPLSSRVTFTAWLCTPDGYRTQLIADYASLDYGLNIKGGGNFNMELAPGFDTTYLRDLGLVEIWRKVGGRVPTLDDVFVIQSKPIKQARRGTQFVSIEGPTVTDFLLGGNSRVVAALSGATTGTADDVARSLVLGALGVGAGSTGDAQGRDISTILGFKVEVPRSLGPSISENAFTRSLSDVLSAVAGKSEQAATNPHRLFYYVRPYAFNPLRFEFVVFMDYFGRYRGFTSANPVILSPLFGTLAELERDNDRREEVTSLYISYNAKANETRLTDTTRRNEAVTNFRETAYDSSAATEAEALAEAQSKLIEGKPRRLMRAVVASSSTVRFGAEYSLGDAVGVIGFGMRWEAEVSGFTVKVVPGNVPQQVVKLDDL
jgi:hypothetical protein